MATSGAAVWARWVADGLDAAGPVKLFKDGMPVDGSPYNLGVVKDVL